MRLNIELKADGSGLTGTVRVAKAELDGLARSANAVAPASRGASAGLDATAAAATRADRSARSLSAGIGTLAGLLASIGLTRVVSSLVQTADAMNLMDARLRIVTGGLQEFARAQADVQRIAEETRSSLEATSTLYTRLAQNSESLGLSQERLANIVYSVNAATTLSGTSAQSAAAGITQLAQAFGSGVLSGDEFRSVMENSPRLVKALNDSLGTTTGELRKLAEQQRLTSDLVAEALELQGETLRAEMDQLPLTVGAALQQARNQWDLYVQAVDQSTGETNALSQAILGLSEYIGLQADAAREGGGGLEILGNALKFVVLLVVAAKNAFEGLINILFAAVQTVVEFQRAWTGALSAGIDSLNNYYRAIGSLDFRGAYQALQAGQANVESAVVGSVQRMRAAWSSAGTGIEDALDDVRVAYESLNRPVRENAAATTGASQRTKEHEERVSALRERIKALLSAQNDQRLGERELNNIAAERNRLLAEEKRLKDEKERQSLRERQERERALASADQLLADLREEHQLIGLSADELERYNVIKQLNNDLTRAGIDLGSEEAARRREEVTAQLAANQAKWQAVEIAGEYQRRWVAAIEDVSVTLAEFATRQIRSVRDLTKELLNIVKRWVTQVLAELIKIQIARFFGGAGGNLGAAAMSILGRGAGGAGGLSSAGMAASSSGGSGFDVSGLLTRSGYGGSIAQMFAAPVSGLYNSYAAGEFASGFVGPPQYLSNGSAGGSLGNASMGGILGGLTGAYYGAQNRNSTGSRIAAGAAYGALGFAAGTGVAAGVAAGSVSAGVTAGAGAFSSLGLGAAVPIIGWVLAIAALVDMVSGGKLFGSKFRPESVTSALRIGEEGASASTSLTEVRQRSLFRGRQWRTTELEPGDEALDAASQLWDSINQVMVDSARQLRGEAPGVIEAAIRTVKEFDKKGRETSSKIFVDILGRSWEEASAELAAQRIGAEAIITTIDAVMGTTVEAIAQSAGGAVGEGVIRGLEGSDAADRVGEYAGEIVKSAGAAMMGEASAIAERWRDDAEELLAGAQFLLMAATAMRQGAGLLGEAGTLTDITDLIEDLQRGEESLVQTYQRVSAAAQLLDDALTLSGVSIEATREQLVRFAVDIADAAGGIERAQQLWSNFFQRFYSEAERGAIQRDQLTAFARGQFEGVGLNLDEFTGEGGAALFRQLFEEALPTLSADAVVRWLEAAEALTLLLDAQAQHTQAVQQAVLAQMEAIAAYEEAAQAVRDELAEAGMSEFAIEMRDLNRWTEDTTAALNQAARAAGFQAAAEEDLAAVHQVAANRAAAAIRRLMSAAGDLVAELYGTPLDQINAQISAIEGMYGAQVDGINAVGEAAENVYAAQLAALQDIQQWLDAQRLGDLSTLTPEERLAEARRQFEELLPAAQAGDVEALRRITQLGDTLLREGRSFYASSEPFTELEAFVRGALQGLVDAGPTAAEPGPELGGPGAGVVGPTAELQALYAERDALMAQQEAERRAALVAELSQMIRELIQATGQPLEEIAAAIGLNLAELAGDLGINLQELSVATATGLVDMARQLGVDVAELASAVGVSLGDLGDRQSLLNQALDETLAGIPEEFRAQLRQPLEDIRNATSEADANAALNSLILVSRGFPASIRDLLAPYFSGLDPSQTVTELGTLRTISSVAQDQLDVLRDILLALGGTAAPEQPVLPAGPLPSSPLLPLPPGPIGPPIGELPDGGLGNALPVEAPELVTELRALNEQIQRSLEALGERVRDVELAVEASAESNESTQRALGDLLRMR